MIMQTQTPFNKLVPDNNTSRLSGLTSILITALIFVGLFYYLHNSNKINENK
jgi:membrane protein insertase Oxa1/YidC/SpoIIIJ